MRNQSIWNTVQWITAEKTCLRLDCKEPSQSLHLTYLKWWLREGHASEGKHQDLAHYTTFLGARRVAKPKAKRNPLSVLSKAEALKSRAFLTQVCILRGSLTSSKIAMHKEYFYISLKFPKKHTRWQHPVNSWKRSFMSVSLIVHFCAQKLCA